MITVFPVVTLLTDAIIGLNPVAIYELCGQVSGNSGTCVTSSFPVKSQVLPRMSTCENFILSLCRVSCCRSCLDFFRLSEDFAMHTGLQISGLFTMFWIKVWQLQVGVDEFSNSLAVYRL